MGVLKRTWRRFTAWWSKNGSRGAGPGGSESGSSGYHEARFRADIHATGQRGIDHF